MKPFIAFCLLVCASLSQAGAREPFRSTQSGIAYEPQEGWKVEEHSQGAAFSTVFVAPDGNSRLTFLVLSKALYPEATVENALPPSDAGKQFRKVKSPKTLTVSGFSFLRADFREKHEPVYQARLMTDSGSWRILIIASGPSQQTAEQLLATLSSFSFSPPEPIKVMSDGHVLVDATDVQKNLIKAVEPQRPKLAAPFHQSGTVNLRVIIGKDGRVKDVRVVSGDSVLSNSAVEAVKQWEYRPYYYKGQPVEVETQITINFSNFSPHNMIH